MERSGSIGTRLGVPATLAATAALLCSASPANASPNELEAVAESVQRAVDTPLESVPEPEPLPTSPPIDVLPPMPAPPGPVAPPPASGASAASEGSGVPTGPSEPDVAQPAASPTGTHLSTAVDAAHTATPPGDPQVTARPAAEAGGDPAPSKGAKGVWAIPEPEPPTDAARPESAAPTATGGRSQPAALTDWVGSGPPLPAVLVYLAVFASGLAILVSTRRELGLQTRRRRRL